jgi:Uma2 family endonuclease
MSTNPVIRLTAEQYLALERKAEIKSEFYNGEMFAMSGASRWHNLICGNVLAALHPQLKKRPCTVYPSDMRVKVSPAGLYTYPDVTVVCGEAQFEDQHFDTLLNPTLIVEVLSKTTAAYDQGEKFEQYRKLASLKEYLLIAQDKCHLMRYSRQPDNQWLLLETYSEADTVTLISIEGRLAMADVYAKVEFLEKGIV